MKAQVIEKDGKPEWAVIPYTVYKRLTKAAEILQDTQDYDEAKRAIENGEELVPSEVVYAILDGANPIRVWREYRGLTQKQLADAANISTPYLSQIESGARKGTTDVLSAIAAALDLSLDDIVVSESST